MQHELAFSIILIIGFLSVAVISYVLLKKIRFPYTIGLVVIGIIAGLILKSSDVALAARLQLTPGIILYLILPTLIYDAAINMDLKALLKNIVPILILAIPGVLLSAGIIGGIMSGFAGMTIGAAFLFGALISATDPVAVIALFNEIGAPRRLGTLLDGESIFNDATAIVLFSIVMAAIQSSIGSVGGMIASSLLDFIWVLFGGMFIGVIVGSFGGWVLRLQKDNTILQITISLIMAYVSFITADLFEVSGVMSTLAAGITVSLLSYNVLKHENHYFMEHFWEFFSFVANSFVFLLLGLTEAESISDPGTLGTAVKLLLIVIPAVTLARAAVIFLLVPLFNRIAPHQKIPGKFQAVMFWGGLRGAVPVALVLALPIDFPGREIIVLITFGYILFTLVVQGTTVKQLMSRLGIQKEKSYFDYHDGVSYTMKFPAVRLLELVTAQILGTFKDEGFFVEEEAGASSGNYLLSRGQKYLSVENEGNELIITAADQEDLAYGKQTVYETLLELDNSVSTLESLVKSPEINAIAKDETTGGKTSLNIAKYLKPDHIKTSLVSTEKNAVIAELVDVAAQSGAITDPERVLEAVLEREASMSTGFDNGVAIPHAKIDAADGIILVVGIHRQGVDFDSLDNKPTHLFFLIISPKSQVGPHIQLLAEIGRKMGNAETRTTLLEAGSSEEVMAVLRQKNA